MGWEVRGQQKYYYGKMRLQGKVVSCYLGKGRIAEVFSSVDETCRLDKQLKKEQIRLEKEWEQEAFREINQPIDEVLNKTYKLLTATLLITNHYCHKGQWRKARVKLVKEGEPMQLEVCIDKSKDLDKQFQSLLDKATGKEPESLEISELRRFLRNNPEIWNRLRTLYDITFSNFLSKEYIEPVAVELIRPKLKELKQQLGYNNATSLERLIIEGVILSYLRWITTEIKYINLVNENHSFDKGLYWAKRLNNAQRAYLRACETLARVRKLSRNCPELTNDFSQKEKEMVM